MPRKRTLTAFYGWMDELNRETVKRGYPDWPLPDSVAHGLNCWFEDYDKGLTPAEALDLNYKTGR